MNFSETVFVYPASGDGHARMRIFTPVVEVPFAGHPTLGTAFRPRRAAPAARDQLETGVGVVPVRLEREGARIVFGWMSQPLPTVELYEDEAALLDVLGVEGSELPVELYDNGLRPRVRLPGLAGRGCPATAGCEPGSRNCPRCSGSTRSPARGRAGRRGCSPPRAASGGPRDGSAAGPLRRPSRPPRALSRRPGDRDLQGAEIGRPSKLHARVEGAPDAIERVEVRRSAVIVARGEFRL